jgi:hypothetical protein
VRFEGLSVQLHGGKICRFFFFFFFFLVCLFYLVMGGERSKLQLQQGGIWY